MAFPIVVLISGSGSNLQSIINNCHNKEIVSIEAVISDVPEAYGLVRASACEIRSVVQPQWQGETRANYCHILADTINQFEPKLVVMAGFMKILTPNYFSTVTCPTVNIHPSLLPKYKGLHTHKRVLDAGDTKHGITIHWATEELDGGPIILQKEFDIDPFLPDTEQTLEQKCHKLEHEWYPHVIGNIAKSSYE